MRGGRLSGRERVEWEGESGVSVAWVLVSVKTVMQATCLIVALGCLTAAVHCAVFLYCDSVTGLCVVCAMCTGPRNGCHAPGPRQRRRRSS